MSAWEKFVGFFGIIAAIIIALAMLVLLTCGVILMTFIWVVAWALGCAITIQEEGKLIGYYRWFKFHRK